MKLKLNQVLSYYEELSKIATKNLPIVFGYLVSKNLKILENEVVLIEENRLKLIQRYAEKEKDGSLLVSDGKYKISANEVEKFTKEYNEYLNTEIDCLLSKVSLAELFKIDDEKYDVLTPENILKIDFMIESEVD